MHMKWMWRHRNPMMILQAAILAVTSTLPAAAYDMFENGKLDNVKASFKSVSTGSTGRDSNWSALDTSGWKKMELGDLLGAWNDFSQAIANNPQDVVAYAGRALVQRASRNYNDAMTDANYAVFLNSDCEEARWARGNVNNDINKFSDALADFKVAVAQSPNAPWNHALLGDVYRALGNRSSSYSEYKTAARLYATSSPSFSSQCERLASFVNPSSTRDIDSSTPGMIVEDLSQTYKCFGKQAESGRALFATSAKWPLGHVVTVAFNGGDPALRKLIADTVPEWSKYGNIKFDFIDPSTGKYREWTTHDTKYSADIRIGFDQPNAYWSVIGQQSVTDMAPNEKTMNLAPANWQQLGSFFTGTILHEFGHAMGFLHEHQHPNAGGSVELRWLDDPGYVVTKDNRGVYMADSEGRLPGLFSYYVATQGWMPPMTYAQIATYEDSTAFAIGPLDTRSIMQYAQDAFLLKTGKASPCYAELNSVLSAGDKIAIQQQYPGPTSQSGARDVVEKPAEQSIEAAIKPKFHGTVRGEFNEPARGIHQFDVQGAGSIDIAAKGSSLMRSGDYAGAVNLFTQSINRDPQNIQAIMLRADARQKMGDCVNAMADLSTLRIAPLEPWALVERGKCNSYLSNYKGALDNFNASLALDSTGDTAVEAYECRAIVKRATHDIPGAFADCNAALQLKPNDLNSLWQRGITYFESSQYQQAVADLKYVIANATEFADAHLLLAQCFEKLGRKTEAVTECKTANYIFQKQNNRSGIEQTETLLKELQG